MTTEAQRSGTHRRIDTTAKRRIAFAAVAVTGVAAAGATGAGAATVQKSGDSQKIALAADSQNLAQGAGVPDVEAAAPVLVIVGAMMMAQVKLIDFSDLTIGLPAFLTIVMMPFTYSIANGIGIGFVAYVVLQVGTGKWRKIHPLMYLVAILFAVYFAIDPIKDALA
jgi:AGZA family xanthine/uracil permease-like MFS transporter